MTAYLCAEAARDRGDRLIGSAGPATTWVLLESPGAWPREIGDLATLADNPAATALFDTAAHSGGRVLAIRRPRTRSTPTWEGTPALAVVSQRFATSWWSHWQTSDDLLAAADLLRQVQQARTGEPLDPTRRWRRSDDQVLLVCAHAKHDPCCAVRGRAVAAVLAAHWPELTWESSHLGGDRFAGNLLVGPQGYLYGNLDGDDALRCVGPCDRPHLAHLRGVSGLTPHAQAAVAEVLSTHSELGLADLSVTGATKDGPNAWVVRVQIRPLEREAQIRVVAERRETARLTCHAAAAAQPLRLSATTVPG